MGLARCRVTEYLEVPRCNRYQGYGHMEARCRRDKIICGFVARSGIGCPRAAKRGKPPGARTATWDLHQGIRVAGLGNRWRRPL